MVSESDTQQTILVVDDEPTLADLYATVLRDEYDVRTAYDGEAATEAFDTTVDVVLLDRRMPNMSGDEVLEWIRGEEGSCQVIMVTAVEPDFDILELGFDAYVTKPVDREDLHDIVSGILRRRTYDDRLQDYYRDVGQRAVLRSKKSESELASSEAFAELEKRIDELESALDRTVDQFGHEDFEAAFHSLDSG